MHAEHDISAAGSPSGNGGAGLRARLRSDWLPVLALVLAAYPLLFHGLGSNEMQPWDEALYAIRARACVIDGAWMDQTARAAGGLYSSAQPPLEVWLNAASFRLFGISEWSARLPSALAALLLVVGLYLFLRRHVSRIAAFAAAASLVAAEPFLHYAGAAQLDLVQLAAGAFAFFLFFQGWETQSRRLFAAAGILLGLALLAKLFLALLAIGLWMSVLCATELRRGGELRRGVHLPLRAALWTLLPAVMLAAPWYIGMAARHPGYLSHIVSSVAVVAVNGYSPSSGLPWWYYVNRLALALPLLPVAFATATAAGTQARLRNVAVAWLCVPLLLLSLGATKMPHFVLPLLLPAALLIAVGTERAADLRSPWKQVLAACIALCLLWGVSPGVRIWSREHTAIALAAAALLAVAAFVLLRTGAGGVRALRPGVVLALCAALLVGTRCADRVLTVPDGEAGARAVGDLLRRGDLRRAIILHRSTPYSDRVPALAWYLDDWEQREAPPETMLQRGLCVYGTLPWKAVDSLPGLVAALGGDADRAALVLHRPWLRGAAVPDADLREEARARRMLDSLGLPVLVTRNYEVWLPRRTARADPRR